MAAEIAEALARQLGADVERVRGVCELLDQGLPPVFVAHYRKAATSGMDEPTVRRIAELRQELLALGDLRETVRAQLRQAGALTDDLARTIAETADPGILRDLLLPYKPGRRTAASVAAQRGLGPLADYAWAGPADGPDLEAKAAEFVHHDREVHTPDDALAGAGHILAERISTDPKVRQAARDLVWERGVLVSKQAKAGGKEAVEFRGYFAFREELRRLPPHRVLAVNRGERSKVLKVAIEVPPEALAAQLVSPVVRPDHRFHAYLARVATDALGRLVLPAMEREVRRRLTDQAEAHAIEVFAANIRSMLMRPPVRGKRVLVVQPGYRSGCKVVVLDADGGLLGETLIYPHEPQKKWNEAKAALLEEARKHAVDIVAIGNGTGCRDTEQLVSEVIAESGLDLRYTITSEAGASVFADSDAAKREFPNLDAALRATVSIGRRLQDPLAELVKIDPRSVGVGLYQHDVDQARLKAALHDAVESCVAAVGVDANTASPEMLAYVPGLGPAQVQVLCIKRAAAPVACREELKSLPGWDDRTFLVAAGLLRVRGANALDATAVHPASYALAERILEHLGRRADDLKDAEGARAVREALTGIALEPLAAQLGIPLAELMDLVGALQRPDWDPRSENHGPIFRKRIQQIEDLQPGMWVKGTVRNVVDFGAFVDIGLKEDGLVHISQFSRRYVRDPLRFLHVGDVVDVRIVGLDRDRGRIALTLISEAPPKSAPARRPARQGVRPPEAAPRAAPAAKASADRAPAAAGAAGAGAAPPRAGAGGDHPPRAGAERPGAPSRAAGGRGRTRAEGAPSPPEGRQPGRARDRKERTGPPSRGDRGKPRSYQPRIIVSKNPAQDAAPPEQDEKGRPKLRWAYYDSDPQDEDAVPEKPV